MTGSEILELRPKGLRRINDGPADQARWEAEQWMEVQIGSSFGQRRQPRVRAVKGRAGIYIQLGTRRTKRAAYRYARELRGGLVSIPRKAGQSAAAAKSRRVKAERRPLRVWPLPKARGRKTQDWAVGVNARAKPYKGPRYKPNPQVLAITNPTHARDLAAAKRKYRQFHGVDVEKITVRGPKNAKKSRVLIVMGRLVDLIYEPRRGERKAIHWIHAFGRDARLCTDVSGKHLYIVTKEGTRQVDFSRGIIS